MRNVAGLWMLTLLIILFVGTAACASGGSDNGVGQIVETDGGSYIDITPPELQGMLEVKDFSFVNVHVPYEGEIEPTDLFIPFDEMEDNLDGLPSATDAKIILYCRSGNMSATAAKTLVRLGYTNVWNLAGGMIAWEDAGYPVVELQ